MSAELEQLERFLQLVERAGAWEGVSLFAKALILRHARHDPEHTHRRLQALAALWQVAQEEPDGRRSPDPGRPGRAPELALDAAGRAAGRLSPADAPGAGAEARPAGARAEAGAEGRTAEAPAGAPA